MATTFDAILRIGARVQGVGDVRALSNAMRQLSDETKQQAAVERAQANLSRVLLDNQAAAARTEKERAAIAAQRLQLSVRVAETEYAATLKQLAAQKQLQAAQVKDAADRVRAANAAMQQALVTTNAMRSEKIAAEENLRVQIQKARAQYESISNLKQIAGLERQAAISAAEGARLSQARVATQTQGILSALQQVRTMAAGAAAAFGVFSAAQVVGGIIQAGQEAEMTRRRINALAGSLGETAGVYEIAARGAKQFAISNIDSRNAVANLYNRLRPMGVSLNEIETVFSGVNKAALLGGLSAYDASEAFRQLGQAMGSGRLQGDELRSLMERMPAIGIAVAKVMGVTVDEVKALGAEGKITTDIITKATVELDKLQPPEPTALQRYEAAVRDLSMALGESLLPQLIPAIKGLTDFVEIASANADKLGDILGSYASAVAKTMAVSVAYIEYIKALYKFNYQGQTDAVKNLIATWNQIDENAYKAKVEAVNRKLAEEGVSESAAEYNRQLLIAQRRSAELAAAKERQAAIEKEMLEAQRQAVAYVDVQFKQVEHINNAATARAENMRDMAQQTLSVEQAQIDVARAILDGKMSMATTDEQRLEITRQIAELDRQAAQANYAAVMAQIDAEQQLETIRVINAENNFRRARAAYDIAVELGTLTSEIISNLETARSALAVSGVQNVGTERSLSSRRTVAGLQLKAANIRANTASFQTPTGNASANNVGNIPIAPGGNFLEINGQVLSGLPAFAKGAHVKGPTLAWIGEGGEGESVVPDSKRLAFAMNVLRGMSGAAAIPAFANGGYVVGSEGMYRSGLVSERQFINNIGRSSGPKTGLMKEYERRVAQAAQQITDPLILSVKKNFIATDLGLTPSGSTTPMLGLYAPSGYDQIRRTSPTSVMAAPRDVNVSVPIKAQEVAPDMFLVNGSEVRRMALEVAQQAIATNNANQRQPSARRMMGVR